MVRDRVTIRVTVRDRVTIRVTGAVNVTGLGSRTGA